MPFGAQLRADGSTRFRLWAPTAQRVELWLERRGERALIETPEIGAGWREVDVTGAQVGELYRYRIDGELFVPDPASRFNPQDVGGPSMVVDPKAFEWTDDDWRGRPWHEAILYELHVGTFTPEGTYEAAQAKLDHLVELGVSAIELMPIADFPGQHNWGYDGVLPFAPEARYGTPEALKSFICAAHARNLMVLLDVVYNHFGPQGNYLHRYAGQFFTERHKTPWGAAINFDSPGSEVVREFYVHNALYWIDEYHLDGLRFDAVHAIKDDSTPHVLNVIAQAVRSRTAGSRPVHLILENDDNEARYLGVARDDLYDAQWNDDVHHCLHVLLTGERDGYYSDYAPPQADPRRLLGRALVEGYAYQGDPSAYRHGARRGERSDALPTTCFVDFLQNHDQIGNRAMGERIGKLAPAPALRAGVAMLLLSPHIPMLFMGEEWNADQPFLFFCDFDIELAALVREGRRGEFARFERFRDETARLLIPDPCAVETFERSRLDWGELTREPHASWFALYRQLLAVRHREILPRLAGTRGETYSVGNQGELCASWRMGDGSRLQLCANLQDVAIKSARRVPGRLLFTTHAEFGAVLTGSDIPAWNVTWSLEQTGD